MGWTTGKDPEHPGTFKYELWSDSETIHSVGGFDTMQEADQAGARANSNWLLYGITDPAQTLDDVLAELLDDELLAELLDDELLAELLGCLKDTPIKD
jgi:hypothetical protein